MPEDSFSFASKLVENKTGENELPMVGKNPQLGRDAKEEARIKRETS